MRVILFKEQFIEAVRKGEKTQTIRKTARCKPGDALSLRRWTGKPYRSKQEIIGEVKCTSVQQVVINQGSIVVDGWVEEDEGPLSRLAQYDGFDNWIAMVEWFRAVHGLPFCGELIKWGGAE
jgi:hypothetical protein